MIWKLANAASLLTYVGARVNVDFTNSGGSGAPVTGKVGLKQVA
ncbi:MAG TPA: hypothetical protein VHX61_09580 [Rhizomicrobium sp.]|nr:hypothetical protein [Rhizomicrobium sp.]